MARPTHLLDAIQALKERLAELAPSLDSIECKAEGMLETALAAVESAANLLGEDNP
jgi:hypothetical protein